MPKQVLAFDFGASGGRAVIVGFDGAALTFNEVHRFSNDPVMLGGTFYWDVLRLFFEIRQGLTKAKLAGGFDSVAINTCLPNGRYTVSLNAFVDGEYIPISNELEIDIRKYAE